MTFIFADQIRCDASVSSAVICDMRYVVGSGNSEWSAEDNADLQASLELFKRAAPQKVTDFLMPVHELEKDPFFTPEVLSRGRKKKSSFTKGMKEFEVLYEKDPNLRQFKLPLDRSRMNDTDFWGLEGPLTQIAQIAQQHSLELASV